jgi:hypothetical protein
MKRLRGIDMTVVLDILAMGEEPLRNHKMKIVPGARHRHIEEAPLLLDPGRGAGAAVRCVEEVGFAVDSPLEEGVSSEPVSEVRNSHRATARRNPYFFYLPP